MTTSKGIRADTLACRIALKIGHLEAVESSETGVEEDTSIPQTFHYTRSIARIVNAGSSGELDKAEISNGQANEDVMQRRFRSMVCSAIP